ncbi:MAG: twin-arginine translocase subunit TatC [Haloferacaceae archaeon]
MGSKGGWMAEDRETPDSGPEPNPDPAGDGADDGSTADGVDADDDPVADASGADADATRTADGATDESSDADSHAAGETPDATPDEGESTGDGDEDATPPAGTADEATALAPEGPAVADGATVGTGPDEVVDPEPEPDVGVGAPIDDPLVTDREGPEDDVEMPLADHIEEMVRRLAIVLLVGGLVALFAFPFADKFINYVWNAQIPGAATMANRRPRIYGPLELVMTELKVAGLAGLVVGLPVLVYQSYRFMRPGLYPRERRYYLAAVPTSLVLAFVGVAFAHFVVLPAIFAYFTSYTTGTAVVAFGLRDTFNLILLLMGYMAIVFQIPLFIELGIMMGLVTREWLEDKRLLFWGAFAGLSFLVSPDPTGMAPIVIIVTMVTLFEGTLALLRWTGN